MEFKITSIDLLGDAKDKYISRINLKVEADRITDALARELGELLKGSPGKCKVNFQLVSSKENLAIEAPSRGLEVNLNDDFMRDLDAISDVSYTLN
jgi:hypothetical protein